jgi:hypothetical protein
MEIQDVLDLLDYKETKENSVLLELLATVDLPEKWEIQVNPELVDM